jgi:hypothetical protein
MINSCLTRPIGGKHPYSKGMTVPASPAGRLARAYALPVVAISGLQRDGDAVQPVQTVPRFDSSFRLTTPSGAEADISDIQSEVRKLPCLLRQRHSHSRQRDLFAEGDFNLRPTDPAMVVTDQDAAVGSGLR